MKYPIRVYIKDFLEIPNEHLQELIDELGKAIFVQVHMLKLLFAEKPEILEEIKKSDMIVKGCYNDDNIQKTTVSIGDLSIVLTKSEKE